MKKFNSFLLLSLLLTSVLVTSCKTTEEVVNDPKDSTDVALDETELALETPSDTLVSDTAARTFFASIERTPCFGRCPTYNMTIYADGTVEYEGIRDVDMIGTYTTTISDKQLQDFIHTAKAIGFLEMKDRYDGAISDLPSTTTTLVVDGVRKSVYRRHDFPKRILTLEQLFDDIVDSAQWKDTNGQPYPPER